MSNNAEEGRKDHPDRLTAFTEHIQKGLLANKDVVWTRMKPSKGEIWVQLRDNHEFTIKVESFDAGTAPKV